MGEIKSDWWIAWASGSKESTNSAGLSAQPWLEDLETEKREEYVWPVSTCAEELEYSVLIILIKVLPKLIASRTDHKYDHSNRSKAFIASSENTDMGVLLSVAASTMWSRRLTLSAASRDFMKPVWSGLTNDGMCCSRQWARSFAKKFKSEFRRLRGRYRAVSRILIFFQQHRDEGRFNIPWESAFFNWKNNHIQKKWAQLLPENAWCKSCIYKFNLFQRRGLNQVYYFMV